MLLTTNTSVARLDRTVINSVMVMILGMEMLKEAISYAAGCS